MQRVRLNWTNLKIETYMDKLKINVEKNKLKSQQIDRRQWINKKTTKRDKMNFFYLKKKRHRQMVGGIKKKMKEGKG
jgi:hypothetical protein